MIPGALAELMKPYAVGDDPISLVEVLTSFPTAVAGPLGLAADEVRRSGITLGRQIGCVPADAPQFPLGALHPSLLGPLP
jgi:hypothetical protein